MTSLARIDHWRRWSVAVLGALFFGVIVGTIAIIHPELTNLDLLQNPLPILLALGLTGYGGWLARSELPAERITRIALWCLGGIVVIGSFATWELSLELAEGESFAETVHVLLRGGTEGALVGGLVGYYNARRREQHRETERANRAITASIDGIALLDEDGQYTEVNRAYADVYGYESPEDFIGESWRMCYTDADREVIEEEVFADLQETGYWRGELTGKRRDGSTFPQEVTLTVSDDGSMVCVVRDITERKEREQALTRRNEMIESLHTATRGMVRVSNTEKICELAVDAARHILDIPNAAIWLSDDTGRRLEPIAQSEEDESVVDEHPVYTPDGDNLSWQAFESGETQVYDDLRTEDALANPETSILSEIIVPVGEHGVMNLGSQTAHSFDETDVRAAELLGSNTVTALERAEHEQELEMQLDRMEFFNSILRHDVLNGMTVIRGRAELLTDELDGDQLRDADTILDWSDDVIEIVQRVQTILDTLIGENDIQLEPVGLSESLQQEADRIRKTNPEVAFETSITDSVSVRANELLSEVFGNIITNAVSHNESAGLCVSITATEREDTNTAIVRIADNGTGVPDEAKDAIFRRENTSHAKSSGSGFGLFFVDSMVESYGGDVRVEDNDAGGATFVLELPLAEATTLT